MYVRVYPGRNPDMCSVSCSKCPVMYNNVFINFIFFLNKGHIGDSMISLV